MVGYIPLPRAPLRYIIGYLVLKVGPETQNMIDIPVTQGGLLMSEWWQIRAHSVEWLYVLDKLAKGSGPFNSKDPAYVIGVSAETATPMYLLRRTVFPAAMLSKVTGLKVEDLEKTTGIITLRSKPDTTIPEASVNYWGTA